MLPIPVRPTFCSVHLSFFFSEIDLENQERSHLIILVEPITSANYSHLRWWSRFRSALKHVEGFPGVWMSSCWSFLWALHAQPASETCAQRATDKWCAWQWQGPARNSRHLWRIYPGVSKYESKNAEGFPPSKMADSKKSDGPKTSLNDGRISESKNFFVIVSSALLGFLRLSSFCTPPWQKSHLTQSVLILLVNQWSVSHRDSNYAMTAD